MATDTTESSEVSLTQPSQFGLLFNPGKTSEFCVLDTEATGLSATHDRLVEVAAINVTFDNTNGTFVQGTYYHQLINPKRAIDPEATRVHGHTAESLAGYPTFKKIAKPFLEFIAGKYLLIHNANYDVGMINAELKRQKLGTLQDHVAGIIDTLELARSVRPHLKNTLDVLCDHYKIDRSARTLHGALIDCELLAAVSVPLIADFRKVIKPRLELLGFDPYAIDYTLSHGDLIDPYARLLALQQWVAKFLAPLKETIIRDVCAEAGIPLNPAEVMASFVVPVNNQFEISVGLRTNTDHASLREDLLPDLTDEELAKYQKQSLTLSLRKTPFKKRELPILTLNPVDPDETSADTEIPDNIAE